MQPLSSGDHKAQPDRDVGPTLVYCWPTVYDGGPTVNQRCVNVSCLLGGSHTSPAESRGFRSRLRAPSESSQHPTAIYRLIQISGNIIQR